MDTSWEKGEMWNRTISGIERAIAMGGASDALEVDTVRGGLQSRRAKTRQGNIGRKTDRAGAPVYLGVNEHFEADFNTALSSAGSL
jgi:hypothetical protein